MKKSAIYLAIACLSMVSVTNAKTTTSFSTEPKSTVIYNITPLSNAVVKGDIDTVKKLLEYGANVNEVSNNGMTPLMLAARYNKCEMISILIEKGAKINTKDNKGFTAYKHAKISGAKEAMELLDQIKKNK